MEKVTTLKVAPLRVGGRGGHPSLTSGNFYRCSSAPWARGPPGKIIRILIIFWVCARGRGGRMEVRNDPHLKTPVSPGGRGTHLFQISGKGRFVTGVGACGEYEPDSPHGRERCPAAANKERPPGRPTTSRQRPALIVAGPHGGRVQSRSSSDQYGSQWAAISDASAHIMPAGSRWAAWWQSRHNA